MDARSSDLLARCKGLVGDGLARDAIGPLQDWLEQHSHDAEAWAILAAAFFELEEWNASADAARRVTELRPSDARHWSNLGTVLRKLGRFDDAEQAQHHALRLDPTYRRAAAELKKARDARLAARGPAEPVGPGPGVASRPTAGSPRPRAAKRRIDWFWAVIVAVAALVVVLAAAMVLDSLNAAGEARAEREKYAAEREAQRQREWADLAQQRAAESEARRRYEIDEQMRRNTVEYLDAFQSTGEDAGDRTDAQTKARWDAEFEGQWIRWEGTVVEVTGRGETCSVSMRCGRETLTSDTRFDLDREAAVTLNRGQKIRVEGRLADHDASGYTLTDVSVVARW